MVERWTRDAQGFVTWPDGEWVRYSDYAALEAQLAVARKALEEISEPETVWRRRAEEDGIRLTANDLLALAMERTPQVISRAALKAAMEARE